MNLKESLNFPIRIRTIVKDFTQLRSKFSNPYEGCFLGLTRSNRL